MIKCTNSNSGFSVISDRTLDLLKQNQIQIYVKTNTVTCYGQKIYAKYCENKMRLYNISWDKPKFICQSNLGIL